MAKRTAKQQVQVGMMSICSPSRSELCQLCIFRCQCLHLLVKHRDSRRPASWRQDPITISKEEAIDKLRNLKSEIISRAEADQEEADHCDDYGTNESQGKVGATVLAAFDIYT